MIKIPSLDKENRTILSKIVADKIFHELNELENTIGTSQGRWVWELLQNAKDSISEEDNKKISAQIISQTCM